MKIIKHLSKAEEAAAAAAMLGKNSWKKRSQGKTKAQIAEMMGKVKRGKKKLSTPLSTPIPLQ